MEDVTETLRKAVRNSGLTSAEVARAADMDKAAMHRFLNGKTLQGGSIDKLARYFKLELQPAKKRKED